jgi:hypothetical protein
MTRCIHITPELPPKVGGVADYTALLSRRLVEVSDGALKPVLVHAGREPADALEVDFPVVDLSGKCSATALAEAVRRSGNEANGRAVVLLEYSGYGYSMRGAPLWLARGLHRVCEDDALPLVTMFHELYAMGPPWTSAFWVSALQRLVAAGLARMSKGIVTNRASARPWLRRYRASVSGTVHVQPVFSNVGEPNTLPAFDERARQIVVFGGGDRKAEVYEDNQTLLRHLVDHSGFFPVLDLGPTRDSVPSGEPWSRPLGVCPEGEISDRLASVSLGVLSYPGSRLGKSGVAAAFAAHGVPFLLLDEEDTVGDTDPYVEGEHFLREGVMARPGMALPDERLAEMSRSIRSLYEDRLHSTHAARRFLGLLSDAANASRTKQPASAAE